MIPKYRSERWHKQIQNLFQNIFAFCQKVLVFSLDNNSNLHRWKILHTPNFNLYDGKQAQLHVLNNCPTLATEERYRRKHDLVLYTLAHYLTALENFGLRLYAELEGYEKTGAFFNLSKRDSLD